MRNNPYQAQEGEVFTVKDRRTGEYVLKQKLRGAHTEHGRFKNYDDALDDAKKHEEQFKQAAGTARVFLPLDYDD